MLNLQPAIFWNSNGVHKCTAGKLPSPLEYLLSFVAMMIIRVAPIIPSSFTPVVIDPPSQWKFLRNIFLRYPLHCSDIVELTNHDNSEYYLRLSKWPSPDGKHNRYRQSYKSPAPSCLQVPECSTTATMLLVIVRPKDQDHSTTFREVTLWSTSSPRDCRTVTHGDLVLIHASHSASWSDSSKFTILVCSMAKIHDYSFILWRICAKSHGGKRDASHHPIYWGFIGKSSTWVISNVLLYITQHDEQNYVLSNTDS